jgi:phosphoglycerol transferase MdoB-like AlkP superfamily enzyme
MVHRQKRKQTHHIIGGNMRKRTKIAAAIMALSVIFSALPAQAAGVYHQTIGPKYYSKTCTQGYSVKVTTRVVNHAAATRNLYNGKTQAADNYGNIKTKYWGLTIPATSYKYAPSLYTGMRTINIEWADWYYYGSTAYETYANIYLSCYYDNYG